MGLSDSELTTSNTPVLVLTMTDRILLRLPVTVDCYHQITLTDTSPNPNLWSATIFARRDGGSGVAPGLPVDL